MTPNYNSFLIIQLMPLFIYALYAHFCWIRLIKVGLHKRVFSLMLLSWIFWTISLYLPTHLIKWHDSIIMLAITHAFAPIFIVLGIPWKIIMKLPILLVLISIYCYPFFWESAVLIMTIIALYKREPKEIILFRNLTIFVFGFLLARLTEKISYFPSSCFALLGLIGLYLTHMNYFAKIRIKEWSQLCLLVIFLSSCSFQETLNMQSFQYGNYPSQVSWVMLPGMEDEHLILHKYNSKNLNTKTFWESAHCIGKVWNYNLYNAHPPLMDSIVMQLSGTNNVIKACPKSSSVNPLWGHTDRGHKIAILEIGNGPSLTQLDSCKDFARFDRVLFFKMQPKPVNNANVGVFNATEQDKNSDNLHFQYGHIYHDSSCFEQDGKTLCHNSVLSNLEFIYEYLKRNEEQFIFLILDYRYNQVLTIKNSQEMYAILEEYNEFFEKMHQSAYRYLTPLSLITAPNPQTIRLAPTDTTNPIIDAIHPGILGTVYAKGARAENFCGMYEQSEILNRILLQNNTTQYKR